VYYYHYRYYQIQRFQILFKIIIFIIIFIIIIIIIIIIVIMFAFRLSKQWLQTTLPAST